MPSSPVHLLLAYDMAESLGVKDKADFLLGAIAPDCVNYGMEQASEKVRYTAHIRDKDYDKWKAQLKAFAKDNAEQFADSRDFLRGYLFHCWSDIAWDEAVQPKIFEFLGTLGFGYDDMTAQKWKELYKFNSLVTKQADYAECVKLVKAGRPRDIAGCSAELIGKFAAYVADDYSDKIIDEAPLFLTEKHIADTILQMDNCGYSDELRNI
ncbi:hypothetical protein [Ruminococcus sp.]|uniref:hypothetical protein n=1 Tax=Ruminococcus sp. TaxID=41978 RepID=UPI001B09B3A4|nr:hypothetical protein [Ruminococcus sp.]MBO5559412.1 hypothetical protein [Ruminococcus sp.]